MVMIIKFISLVIVKNVLFSFCADVDVEEPDERSLITYVSSLYDVFPEVPSVEQSVRDNVSGPLTTLAYIDYKAHCSSVDCSKQCFWFKSDHLM